MASTSTPRAALSSEDAQLQEAIAKSILDAPDASGTSSGNPIEVRQFGTRVVSLDDLASTSDSPGAREGVAELQKVFSRVRFFNTKLELATFYRAWALAILQACQGQQPAPATSAAVSGDGSKSAGAAAAAGTAQQDDLDNGTTQFMYSPKPAVPGGGWGSWNGKPIEGDADSEKEYAASQSRFSHSGGQPAASGTGSTASAADKGAELTQADWRPLQPTLIYASTVPRNTEPEMLRQHLLGTMESCSGRIELAGYEFMVIDDFMQEFQMAVLSADTMTLDQIVEVVEEKQRIQWATVFLKCMAGVGLFEKRQSLESFCKLRDSKLGLADYRAKYIDSTKAEAGVTEVVSMVVGFKVAVRVYSWDEIVGKPVVLAGGSYECPQGYKGIFPVNLLFKDGEYGVLEV